MSFCVGKEQGFSDGYSVKRLFKTLQSSETAVDLKSGWLHYITSILKPAVTKHNVKKV